MQTNIPLAERLRPQSLDDYVGQAHLVGGGGVFRRFLETGNVPSFILSTGSFSRCRRSIPA